MTDLSQIDQTSTTNLSLQTLASNRSASSGLMNSKSAAKGFFDNLMSMIKPVETDQISAGQDDISDQDFYADDAESDAAYADVYEGDSQSEVQDLLAQMGNSGLEISVVDPGHGLSVKAAAPSKGEHASTKPSNDNEESDVVATTDDTVSDTTTETTKETSGDTTKDVEETDEVEETVTTDKEDASVPADPSFSAAVVQTPVMEASTSAPEHDLTAKDDAVLSEPAVSLKDDVTPVLTKATTEETIEPVEAATVPVVKEEVTTTATTETPVSDLTDLQKVLEKFTPVAQKEEPAAALAQSTTLSETPVVTMTTAAVATTSAAVTTEVLEDTKTATPKSFKDPTLTNKTATASVTNLTTEGEQPIDLTALTTESDTPASLVVKKAPTTTVTTTEETEDLTSKLSEAVASSSETKTVDGKVKATTTQKLQTAKAETGLSSALANQTAVTEDSDVSVPTNFKEIASKTGLVSDDVLPTTSAANNAASLTTPTNILTNAATSSLSSLSVPTKADAFEAVADKGFVLSSVQNGSHESDGAASLASGLTQRMGANTFANQLAATTKTAAPQQALQSSVAQQVSLSIKNQVKTGSDELTLQLHPSELGRVEVKLNIASDKTVQATVTADNKSTLDLLKQDQSQLQQALQDAGLNADANCMQFNLRDNGQQAQADAEASGASADQKANDLDGTVSAAVAEVVAQTHYISPTGVDITV